MVGPARKQRKPTISKPTGLDFQSLGEHRSNEENKQKVGKLPHYKPKKRVILLGPAVEEKKETVDTDKTKN